ncbi:MAG TPA: hypothetical protein VIZ19_17885, partial [Roseiarcus sp.]
KTLARDYCIFKGLGTANPEAFFAFHRPPSLCGRRRRRLAKAFNRPAGELGRAADPNLLKSPGSGVTPNGSQAAPGDPRHFMRVEKLLLGVHSGPH